MARVSIAQVAREAGVARPTANRILLGDIKAFRAETASRVIAAAKRLDYRPNMAARGLKTSRSYLVGMLVPSYSAPHLADLAGGAGGVIVAAGSMPVSVVAADAEQAGVLLERLVDHGVDGLIVSPEVRGDGTVVGEARLLELHARGLPIVQVMNGPIASLPAIAPDWELSTYRSTRALIDLGCENVVHWLHHSSFQPTPAAANYKDRLGYERAMREAGREPVVEPIVGYEKVDPTAIGAQVHRDGVLYAAAAELVRRCRPDGVVCWSSDAANHLSQYLVDHPELRPPGLALAHMFRPTYAPRLPETRVVARHDVRRIAALAATAVFDVAAGRAVGQTLIEPSITILPAS